MSLQNPFDDFTQRLKLLSFRNPGLISMTLSNIFTMRLIGNKTHGDLAEIAISEFINQYMYDFTSTHVGKDLFRAKSHEEDISIKNDITNQEILVSLKAYGVGPLQLSTDKDALMFPLLEAENTNRISDKQSIKSILESAAFREFAKINVLPLIYDEKLKRCNILVFDFESAKGEIDEIEKVLSGRGRKHPVFVFRDKDKQYICEVRYGDATANALQRGLWTHTGKATNYFDSVTNGWISYTHNLVLVKLISHALVSSESGHREALNKIKLDIQEIIRARTNEQ